MGSSMMQSTDIPDDNVLETIEELGLGYFEETLEELGSSNLFAKRKRQKLEIGTDNSTLDGFDEASHDSSPDPEMSEDLNVTKCIICSSGKSDKMGNQLVECHECHGLYHQNCHNPRITDQSINDLRHVWYCRNCSKQMKQATPVTSVPKLKPITSHGIQASTKSQTQSFKTPLRSDTKPMFSPTSPSVNQSFVMPNLASTVTAASGSNNGTIKSPGNANPRDVTRQYMKRLQLVKKKAAAKSQQRFTKR